TSLIFGDATLSPPAFDVLHQSVSHYFSETVVVDGCIHHSHIDIVVQRIGQTRDQRLIGVWVVEGAALGGNHRHSSTWNEHRQRAGSTVQSLADPPAQFTAFFRTRAHQRDTSVVLIKIAIAELFGDGFFC